MTCETTLLTAILVIFALKAHQHPHHQVVDATLDTFARLGLSQPNHVQSLHLMINEKQKKKSTVKSVHLGGIVVSTLRHILVHSVHPHENVGMVNIVLTVSLKHASQGTNVTVNLHLWLHVAQENIRTRLNSQLVSLVQKDFIVIHLKIMVA